MKDKKMKYMVFAVLVLFVILFAFFISQNCSLIKVYKVNIESYNGSLLTFSEEMILKSARVNLINNYISLVFNILYIGIGLYFIVALFWNKIFNKTLSFSLILFFISTSILKFVALFFNVAINGLEITTWNIIYLIVCVSLVVLINIISIYYYKNRTKIN